MRKNYCKYLLIVAMMFLLGGCSYSKGIKIMSTESNTFSKKSASFKKFDGEDRKIIILKKGENLELNYKKSVESGELDIKLMHKDETLLDLKENSGKETITAKDSGEYIISIKGKAAKGSYEVKWDKK